MGRAFEYRKAAKMARWGKMSRIFPKLAKSITVAAKEGGIDPDMNSKLRTAILNAKAENMPKDNIEAAIKRASGKDSKHYEDINYEGKGPHGCLLFVECSSDNGTRTVANIRMHFKKNGGELANQGSLEFMFERKAMFEFNKPDMDLDELEMELIDCGLEEMEAEEDVILVTADFKSFGEMNAKFEELGVELTKATLERISTNPKKFTEEGLKVVNKLIDTLEEDEDVQAVFTNIEH